MPKISAEIPAWFNEINYASLYAPDELPYQIFKRQSAFNGDWNISEKFVENPKAIESIKTIISDQQLLRDSFNILKNTSLQLNADGADAITTSIMSNHSPLSGISMIGQNHIPNGTNIIGINLKHSDDTILEKIRAHLKHLRKENPSITTLDWEGLLNQNNDLIHEITKNSEKFLKKWEKHKILQAFDLALWRQATGKKITLTTIANHLDYLEGESKWRKTILKMIKEMMISGVVEAVIIGTSKQLNR